MGTVSYHFQSSEPLQVAAATKVGRFWADLQAPLHFEPSRRLISLQKFEQAAL